MIQTDIYSSTINKFKLFVNGNDILRQFFNKFSWLDFYPSLEQAEIEHYSSPYIFKDLEFFSFHCNKYLDKQVRKSSENMYNELMEYRNRLLKHYDPIVETWKFYKSFDIDNQICLDIFFFRTFYPLEGLRTIKLESIFTIEETNLLNSLEKNDASSVTMNPIWQIKKPFQYNNYYCFILKITRLCNLRCVYCHDWREGQGNTIGIVESLFMLSNILKSSKFRQIEFVWHGGEPTLYGVKNFYKLLFAISFFKGNDQEIINTIQINGLSVPSTWIQIFNIFQFSVGISIDGPDESHNENRPDIHGKPTFDKVRRNIFKLRENGIPSNIIIVGNNKIMDLHPEILFDFFVSLSIRNCCILPLLPGNCVRKENFNYKSYRRKYFDFLISLYEFRNKHQILINIREIDTLLKIKKNKNPYHCELLGNCIGTFFSIDPDGSVHHCDKYVNDKEYMLGNIVTESLDSILQNGKIAQLKAENITQLNSLSNCEYFEKCQGWCPHENYLKKLYEPDDVKCCGLKYILEKL